MADFEFSSTTEQKELSLGEFDYGASVEGMAEYKTQLKSYLLDKTIEQLNSAYKNIMTEINKGWQGVARDRFDQHFNDTCKKIGEDLSLEYQDLCARLDEVQAFYFEEDLNLIEE